MKKDKVRLSSFTTAALLASAAMLPAACGTSEQYANQFKGGLLGELVGGPFAKPSKAANPCKPAANPCKPAANPCQPAKKKSSVPK